MSVAIQWIKDNYSYKTTTTSKVCILKKKKKRYLSEKHLSTSIFLLPSIYKKDLNTFIFKKFT